MKKVIWAVLIGGCFLVISTLILTNLINLTPNRKISLPHVIKTDTLTLFDSSTIRIIPVILYSENINSGKPQKLVIIAHGHGIKNSDYDYISSNLAMQGYTVASIQYELPEDAEMDITGNSFSFLKASWDNSAKSFLFVIQFLKTKYPNLDCQNLTLIGHSRGGDILMLFAQEHPEWVVNVISLDNCHMPLLRTKKPRIFSLRAKNSYPDSGVLPTPGEQEKYNIHIVHLKNISHMDMCFGTADQKEEINRYITEFLKQD